MARLGLSERQYAAHAGVSRGAVQKAKAAGRLALFPDGSIDAPASDARRAAMTDPSKQRGPQISTSTPVAAAGDGSSFHHLKADHEALKIEERQLRLQKGRREVVDRAQATELVLRLAHTERDAWVTWPNRVAALMAAEIGVGVAVMQQVLERHVRAHLDELSEVRIEFT